jgi:hypothetical protein
MVILQCLCGFTELADESLTDHLHRVFAPQNGIGRDGEVHDEASDCACLCGLRTDTAVELDEHFLAVFTPDDAIGDDGQQHGLLEGGPMEGSADAR